MLLSSTDTYISIDRKYISGGVNIYKHDFQLVGKRIDIEIDQEIKTRGYENIELQNRTDNVEIKLPYTDNGPHDSYYFNNPERIIAGDPRYPSIDTDNRKLLYRHLNVIYVADFLKEFDVSANDIGIIEFAKEYGHPILVVSATDIAGVLRKNAITSNNIGEWLLSLDEADNRGTERRLKAYYDALILR